MADEMKIKKKILKKLEKEYEEGVVELKLWTAKTEALEGIIEALKRDIGETDDK